MPSVPVVSPETERETIQRLKREVETLRDQLASELALRVDGFRQRDQLINELREMVSPGARSMTDPR